MSFAVEVPNPASWASVHALLAPAIAHGGDTNTRELIDDLLSDRAQLWVKRADGVPIAAAVTTLHVDQSLHCQLLGGKDMADWLDELIATVAKRARAIGVQAFTMEGRPGWERVLAAKGWKRQRIVMGLKL